MSAVPLDANLPAQALARLLLSGPVGMTLYGELHARFPRTARDDLYFGIALAWTDREAALVAAEAEIAGLRRQVEGLTRKSAA